MLTRLQSLRMDAAVAVMLSLISAASAAAQGAVTMHVVVTPAASQTSVSRAGFTVCFGTTAEPSKYGSGSTSNGGVVNQNIQPVTPGSQVVVTAIRTGYTGARKSVTVAAGSNHVDLAPTSGTGGPTCGQPGSSVPPAQPPATTPPVTKPPASPPATSKPPAASPTSPPASAPVSPPVVSYDGIALIPLPPSPSPSPTLTPAEPGKVRIVVTVTRAGEGTPLTGASVCVGENYSNLTSYGATGFTNSNGQIAFNVPPVGTWLFVANKAGFRGQGGQYHLGANQTRGIVSFPLVAGSGGPACPAASIGPTGGVRR